ncbi:MAG: P-II family nitrogen regulator [Hyphomicrobiales bacterium]
MKFKLLIVMTDDDLTEKSIEVARTHGATGCTVITSARGEGLTPTKSFFGLTVTGQRDVVLFLIEEHRSREVLEAVAAACEFDEELGNGVAFQIDIEDAIGLRGQIEKIQQGISEEEL